MTGRGKRWWPWAAGVVGALALAGVGVWLLSGDELSEDELALCEALDRPMPSEQIRADVAVFLDADLSREQIDHIGEELREVDGLDGLTYVDQEAALAEFQEMFGSRPDMIDQVSADILPSSYRLTRAPGGSPDLARIESMPGIFRLVAGLGPGATTVDVLRTVAEAGYVPGAHEGIGSVVGDRLTADVPDRLRAEVELLAHELGVGAGSDTYAPLATAVAGAAEEVVDYYETACS